jgi:hypothetical protein
MLAGAPLAASGRRPEVRWHKSHAHSPSANAPQPPCWENPTRWPRPCRRHSMRCKPAPSAGSTHAPWWMRQPASLPQQSPPWRPTSSARTRAAAPRPESWCPPGSGGSSGPGVNATTLSLSRNAMRRAWRTAEWSSVRTGTAWPGCRSIFPATRSWPSGTSRRHWPAACRARGNPAISASWAPTLRQGCCWAARTRTLETCLPPRLMSW